FHLLLIQSHIFNPKKNRTKRVNYSGASKNYEEWLSVLSFSENIYPASVSQSKIRLLLNLQKTLHILLISPYRSVTYYSRQTSHLEVKK
ncbi:TPA: hypothetical protein ACHYLB_004170, partial [Escherichia coli]